MSSLIVGGDSQIARKLIEIFGCEEYLSTSRNNPNKIFFDLKNPGKLNLPKKIRNAVICIDATTFNNCESNFLETINSNVINLLTLIEFFFKNKIRVLFLSTSAVFSNNNKLSEESIPNPNNEYSIIKRIVEIGINNLAKKNNADFIILRLSKVISAKTEPVKSWLNLNCTEILNIHKNIYIYPLSLKYVANVINKILKSNTKGIFHLCNNSSITYYDLFNFLSNNNFINKDSKVSLISVEKQKYSNKLIGTRLLYELDIDFQSIDDFYQDLKDEFKEQDT